MDSRHIAHSRLALLAMATLLLVPACVGDSSYDWFLGVVIDVADRYESPVNAPVIQFQVAAHGTPTGPTSLTFEYSLNGTTYSNMPVNWASAGTVVGNEITDVPINDLFAVRWDTSAIGTASAENFVTIRVTASDTSGNGSRSTTSQEFTIDNTGSAGNHDPSLLLAGASGGGSTYTLNVQQGTPLPGTITVLGSDIDNGNSLTLTVAFDAASSTGYADIPTQLLLTPTPSGTPPTSTATSTAPANTSITIAPNGNLPTVGAIVFDLEVADNQGGNSQATLTINVNAGVINNDPAVGMPTGPGTVTGSYPSYSTSISSGTSLAFDVEATDPDSGDTLTVTATVSGGTLNAAQAGFSTTFPHQVSGNPPQTISCAGSAVTAGTIQLTISVNDGNGGTDSITLDFAITGGGSNTPPTLSVSGGTYVTDHGGGDYEVTVQVGDPLPGTVAVAGTDPDSGDFLTLTATFNAGASTNYAAIPGELSSSPVFISGTATGTATTPGTPTISINPNGNLTQNGLVVFDLALNDGHGGSDTGTLTVRVNAEPVIGAPSGPGPVTGGPTAYSTTIPIFDSLAFTIDATDADSTDSLEFTAEVTGGTLTATQAGFTTSFPYQATGVSPNTLSLLGTAVAGGTITLSLSVDDRNGGTRVVSLSITIEAEAPVFTSTPPLTAVVGELYTYTPQAVGIPAPSFSASGYPTWMTWNGATLSGTPAVGDFGPTATITLTATNGISPPSNQLFSLSVFYNWTLETTGHTLQSIWGSSGSDAYAVGTGGTILHYDGATWSDQASGTPEALEGVWGSSGSDVFAVGLNGTILHCDGTSWSTQNSGTTTHLRDVWGASGNNVFVVGYSGTILHYDGSTWTAQASGITRPLYGVWGSSWNDVFAVGDYGTILHFDGTTWSSQASGTTHDLLGVWGSSGSDVFAVGYSGTILHYDGSAWTAQTSGTTASFRRIWGSSGSNIFVVGYSGTILNYSGTTWSTQTSGTTRDLFGVWGSTANEVFAVGNIGTILLYNGATWSIHLAGHSGFGGIWGNSGSDVFAVGDTSGTGGTILHYDGATWSDQNSGTGETLNGVWGSSGSDVFSVGTGGTILHYNGATWNPQTSGTTELLSGVWGSNGSDVFAVGQGGTILHYNGVTWSAQTSGTSEYCKSVWGNSGNNVFAVGWSGTVLHYDGSTWSAQASGTTQNLRGVWGSNGNDVFAVGDSGTIIHYDGANWSVQASGTTETLYSVWGSSGSDVFAVGSSDTVLHYDGANWSPQTSGTATSLRGVWGSSGNDVFAVGNSGTIIHYGP